MLSILADEFPYTALKKSMGPGEDMSIIRFYETYLETTPGIGQIMIWSMGSYLEIYNETITMKRRKMRYL